MRVEIVIKGEPKEIADLAKALQSQREEIGADDTAMRSELCCARQNVTSAMEHFRTRSSQQTSIERPKASLDSCQ